jgi:XTP/dITP diphosphohydrolase
MPGTLRRGQRLVIASHNQGKVREMAELLAPFGIETVAASTLRLAEPEETGASFAENAKLKAVAAAKASGLPALADDSGLAVASLGGEPGIHSARWGGPTKDFALAMARVNRDLETISARDRSAKFICALALATQDGTVDVFEGEVSGTLVWPPRGTKGFGYDPIFVPEGFEETFGEMEPELKHAMSHRARAFEQLMLATYEDDDDA